MLGTTINNIVFKNYAKIYPMRPRTDSLAREIFFASVVGLNASFRVDKKRIFTELDIRGSAKLSFLFFWKLSALEHTIVLYDDYRNFYRNFAFRPFEDFHFTIRQSPYLQYWFQTFLQKKENSITYGAITNFVCPRALMFIWLENGFCSDDFKEIVLTFKNVDFRLSKMLLKELNIKPLKLNVKCQFVETKIKEFSVVRILFELESLLRLFILILPHIPNEEFFEHFCLNWPTNYLERWIIEVRRLTPRFNKVLVLKYNLPII